MSHIGPVILAIALLVGTGCGSPSPSEERSAASLTKEVAEYFRPPSSIVDRPPPKFAPPKFKVTPQELTVSAAAKARVTADEQIFASGAEAKPWKDITAIVCAVYGYFAQPTKQLPTDDGFAKLLTFLIEKVPKPPSVRFRQAAGDLLEAIKDARKDVVDWDGVRNASIAAVCEIV